MLISGHKTCTSFGTEVFLRLNEHAILIHISLFTLLLVNQIAAYSIYKNSGPKGLAAIPEPFASQNDQVINPHSYEYLHNPANACSKRKEIEVLIAVPVSSDKFENRQIVRQTWGSYASVLSNNAVLVFFMGTTIEYKVSPSLSKSNSSNDKSNSKTLQERINEEDSLYSDIVQESYADTYRNLTVKTMSILKWANTFCKNAMFVIKADDDIYAVMPRIVHTLRDVRVKYNKIPFIFGETFSQGPPVVRDVKSKFYLSPSVYSKDRFPIYSSGSFYVLSSEAIGPLFHVAQRTPLLHLEDLFITGICAHKAGVSLIRNPSQSNTANVGASGCPFRASYTISHSYTPAEIQKIHNELYFTKNLDCDNNNNNNHGSKDFQNINKINVIKFQTETPYFMIHRSTTYRVTRTDSYGLGNNYLVLIMLFLSVLSFAVILYIFKRKRKQSTAPTYNNYIRKMFGGN